MIDQAEIALKLKQGNKTAFELIYNEYYEMLLYVSLQYIPDREAAKEAVQDAFVKLWVNRHSIDEMGNLRNYLYTIAKNNCLNYLKREKKALQSCEDLKWIAVHYNYEAMHQLSIDSIEFKELQQQVDNAIEKLPPQCREVFKLSRFSDLKNREIALHLGISEKTVESHITKAIALLKKDLLPAALGLLAASEFFC